MEVDEISDLAVYLKFNREIVFEKPYLEAIKLLAEIEGYPSWETLIEIMVHNGLRYEVEKRVASSRRLGQNYSRYLAKKFEINNVIQERK